MHEAAFLVFRSTTNRIDSGSTSLIPTNPLCEEQNWLLVSTNIVSEKLFYVIATGLHIFNYLEVKYSGYSGVLQKRYGVHILTYCGLVSAASNEYKQ